MGLVQVSKPLVPPLSLEEAGAILKLSVGAPSALRQAQDDFISRAIDAATATVDGPFGEIGRCLISQQWQFTFAGFGRGGVELPLAPVISVDEVTFLDRAGVSHVLAPASYRALNLGSDDPAVLFPVVGGSWPETFDGDGSCSVLMTCGYGAGPEFIPADLRMVVGARMATHYQMRESLAPSEFRPYRNLEIEQIVQRYRRRVVA